MGYFLQFLVAQLGRSRATSLTLASISHRVRVQLFSRARFTYFGTDEVTREQGTRQPRSQFGQTIRPSYRKLMTWALNQGLVLRLWYLVIITLWDCFGLARGFLTKELGFLTSTGRNGLPSEIWEAKSKAKVSYRTPILARLSWDWPLTSSGLDMIKTCGSLLVSLSTCHLQNGGDLINVSELGNASLSIFMILIWPNIFKPIWRIQEQLVQNHHLQSALSWLLGSRTIGKLQANQPLLPVLQP